MKMKKIIITVLLIAVMVLPTFSFATVNSIITNMAGVKDDLDPGTGGIGKVINIIIGLLQVAGSGISIIVVTMLGIKYILASVEEKAEIKKKAVPIVIGCVLLFGAVNLMAAVEEFAQTIS